VLVLVLVSVSVLVMTVGNLAATATRKVLARKEGK
jgi:hypothetical protein